MSLRYDVEVFEASAMIGPGECSGGRPDQVILGVQPGQRQSLTWNIPLHPISTHSIISYHIQSPDPR